MAASVYKKKYLNISFKVFGHLIRRFFEANFSSLNDIVSGRLRILRQSRQLYQSDSSRSSRSDSIADDKWLAASLIRL